MSARERTALRNLLSAIALAAEQPPELPVGLAGRVGFLLTLAHHRVREHVNECLGALGITTALYGTLATIGARGPSPSSRSLTSSGSTGPAIVQTVDRLQAAGLVERQRDPADRRSYALQPSSHGHTTLRQARAAIAQINDQLDQLGGKKYYNYQLNRLLRKLLHNN